MGPGLITQALAIVAQKPQKLQSIALTAGDG
jgi:hypothetical protein